MTAATHTLRFVEGGLVTDSLLAVLCEGDDKLFASGIK